MVRARPLRDWGCIIAQLEQHRSTYILYSIVGIVGNIEQESSMCRRGRDNNAFHDEGKLARLVLSWFWSCLLVVIVLYRILSDLGI